MPDGVLYAAAGLSLVALFGGIAWLVRQNRMLGQEQAKNKPLKEHVDASDEQSARDAAGSSWRRWLDSLRGPE